MIKFLSIVIVLMTSSHSLAQQPSTPEEKPLLPCTPEDLFKCISDPGSFPWPPAPGVGELSTERFDLDFKALERVDQQFKSLKEKFGKEPTS